MSGCYRHPQAWRRRDGQCSHCRRNADAYRRRMAGRILRPVTLMPDAACRMTTDDGRLVLVGEVTAAAWDGVADALAHRIDAERVTLDLSAVSHARTLPARVASYVDAMLARCAEVVVVASPYVRACVQASRYGSQLDVRWVTP